MTDSLEVAILDRVLDSVTRCFTPAVAEQIAALRADEATRARIDELATRSDDGTLTDEERREYLAYVEAIDIVGILQAKARAVVRQQVSGHRPPGAVDEFLDGALADPDMRRILEAWAK